MEGHCENLVATGGAYITLNFTGGRIYYTIVTSGLVKMRFRMKRVE